jgi:thiamine biosynthesis protein ThiS
MEAAETKTIQVVVNGAEQTVPAGLNIDRLLEWLKIDASRVAVELNGKIVRKPEWPAAPVHESARIEVVWFVGGG